MMAARTGAMAWVALLLAGSTACSKPKSEAVPNAPSSRGGAGSSSSGRGYDASARGEFKLCQHGVPADLCTLCHPDLTEVFKELGDWCEEHRLPKSHCRDCNPNLTFTAQAPKDWCKEHAVPESMCTQCSPALVAKFIQAGNYCREHGFPASVCPVHHPELVKAAGAEPPVFPAPGTLIRLASPKTADEVGIRTLRIEPRRFARMLEVVGQLDFNQNRLAQLSARGDALILEVKVDLGDDVKAGQPLATLASAAVGSGQAQLASAQARLKAAHSTLQREESLVQKGVTPRRNLEAAQAELAAAEADFGAAKAALGAAGADPGGHAGRYALAAPFAGTVIARNAVAGRSAASGQVLVQVADLSTMWVQLDVPEADASLVRPGQRVILSFEGIATAPREATIARVGASVDPSTRTVAARVELPSPERALKAGSFVRAKIQVSGEHDALLVPLGAVQRAGGQALVFVKKGAGLYEPIPVSVGGASQGLVEIVKGLWPGVEIVTTGAFLLKTEVLKDSIGAGCCEEGGGE